MPGIALKNFRGFQEAYIPLTNGSNFFVGENSTGKTSVLSLIEILSTHNFYFTHELASDYVDFSAYEDAVSIKTPKKDMAIGYFRFTYSKLKRGTIDALCFHFGSDKGRTELTSVQYAANGYIIEAKFRKTLVQFTVHKAAIDIEQYSHPKDALKMMFDGAMSTLQGELIYSDKYSYSNLPMPSPLISALNILSLEKIRNSEDDPLVRVRIRHELFDDLKWIAPIRAKPQGVSTKIQNTYSAEGEHIPSLIRRAFGQKGEAALANRLKSVVTSFGKDSHLFDSIGVQEYGQGPTSPYEVQIQLGDHFHRLSNVGYGVSQSLPVLIEVASSSLGETFIIQQPEVHLHPRAQAAFGEFLHDMTTSRKHSFLIETHSDYLIDRFRLQMKKKRHSNHPASQVLFFSKSSKGFNTVSSILLNKDGSLPEKLPNGYREFFLREELQLLSIR